MTANTSPRIAAWEARVRPLFRGPFVATTGLSFLIFGTAVVVASMVLIALGRVDLALPMAWAVALIEVALMAAKKMRLKVPLTVILAVLGPAMILLASRW
ncbi:MAG: hypothetical protein Q8J78_02430 [Moraxellaceae bacterium]|jgi:hypothetical protein|nr:hypothetical protein [Moraxellaceae bacterium]